MLHRLCSVECAVHTLCSDICYRHLVIFYFSPFPKDMEYFSSCPTSVLGGHLRPERLFRCPFSSPSRKWNETQEVNQVAIATTLLKHHLLGCVGISPCSEIGEDENSEIQRKFSLPLFNIHLAIFG